MSKEHEPQSAEAVRCSALVSWRFWVVTLFWDKHKSPTGVPREGGYSTVWLDGHPAEELARLQKRYGDVMHIVSALPVSHAHYVDRDRAS